MTRTKPPTTVEQIGSLLDEGCAPDEIAVLLRLDEREVRRVVQLLAEATYETLVPADTLAPQPGDDEPADDAAGLDDVERPPTREEVQAAALLCRRAVSGTDLDDLAGALGIRHAVEPAERWLNARQRAAAQFASGTPSSVLEGVQRAKERLREHVAGYAIEQSPTGIVVGDVVPPGPRIEVTAGAVTVHQHEPFPVADDTGTWHAECECGTRWTSTLCDWPGCGAVVTALVVAQTGLPRHKHHRATS